ncbi:energy-coupling factor transporter transmembrane component T [Butyrivibrio fibrisolvens]|uniref:energy-coupling factor transporter transmembrane component T n=1 Tax=Butyrivibrio fibrisolvens TaxID=831 RepID=UPI0020BDC671|nr:energy-coupling factor transporter transmembrane component T [Butyrivibrio fibrisolvens]
MSIKLDPRTKIYMILSVSTIVMMSATTPFLWAVRLIITIVPILLLIAEKRYASALRFFALYMTAVFINFRFLSAGSTGFFMAFLTGYCGIIVQFMPAFITVWYVVRTTKIDEFMSAMQKMHIPDGITISLAVIMRFFPTIKEEYDSIRDAMRMRGISLAGGDVIKMVEFRMVPLIFACVNIGDELSAAAITRGLGGKVKRSSVVELKLNIIDILLFVFFTIATTIFVFHKYFRL